MTKLSVEDSIYGAGYTFIDNSQAGGCIRDIPVIAKHLAEKAKKYIRYSVLTYRYDILEDTDGDFWELLIQSKSDGHFYPEIRYALVTMKPFEDFDPDKQYEYTNVLGTTMSSFTPETLEGFITILIEDARKQIEFKDDIL